MRVIDENIERSQATPPCLVVEDSRESKVELVCTDREMFRPERLGEGEDSFVN